MIDVTINADGFSFAPVALLERAVRAALAEEAVASAELSVTLLDDDSIQALNRQYLDRDRPTDVIAFSLDDDATLGDVYLGAERAREQASEAGIEVGEELVRLAVHGTLHVLGYDHPDGPERLESPMFVVQERLVARVLSGD